MVLLCLKYGAVGRIFTCWESQRLRFSYRRDCVRFVSMKELEESTRPTTLLFYVVSSIEEGCVFRKVATR